MPDVSYVPGSLVAVAGDHCLALVEAAPDSDAATRIWQRIGLGTSAEAVLADLLGGGFEGMGGFALLVGRGAGQRRLFCRGAIGATVEGSNVLARIDGIGLATWREYVVTTDAERVVLGQPPDENVLRLPVTAGLLLAQCVIIDLTRAASRETIPYDSPARGYSAGLSASGRPDPAASPSDLPGESQAADRAEDDNDSGSSGWDIRESDVGATAPRYPDTFASVVVTAHPAVASPGSGSPDGLIDAVQWGPGPGAAADPSTDRTSEASTRPPLSATGPGGTEVTVMRAVGPAPDEAGQAAVPATPGRIGPDVPALVCPAGHANPPSEEVCRQCGAALPNDAIVVPRPTLGVLLLSTGEVVTLDRGVVMGRDPQAGLAGPHGREQPHVVRLPSAGGDISRTHLRVTLDGWHVLVTDLHSTNGTLVSLPGRDPEQVRPGEPVPIRPGTLVTLADGIDFRYEVCE